MHNSHLDAFMVMLLISLRLRSLQCNFLSTVSSQLTQIRPKL